MLLLQVMMKVISSTQKFFLTKISCSVIIITEVIVVLETSADTSIIKKFAVKQYAENHHAVKDIQ